MRRSASIDSGGLVVAEYLLQQRMHFASTVETPFGLTQAEIRILYLYGLTTATCAP